MVKLIIPEEKYLASYREAFNEYNQNNVDTYFFMDSDERDILLYIENYRNGTNLPEDRVPASYYWLVDGDEFIGEICIRHALNDFLINYGGHIGYGVRYSEWNKGYGSLMLKLTLEKARELGLKKVLITCDDDNIGSAGVIEHNGGILENKVHNTIDEQEIITRRYWIDL